MNLSPPLIQLEVLRRALHEECHINPEDVTPQGHILNDLGIDSLDLLNAAFRLEKDTGVKVPFRDWLALEYGDQAPERSPFLVSEICGFLAAASGGGAG
ncbi:MAG: phosphopantetheine-binding protein [Phenylobacterium sp.]|jgi:acyl carrier protein